MKPALILGHLTTHSAQNNTMTKNFLTLGVLLIGLITREAHSQVYSVLPQLFTNTLASSSGGSTLLGINLGQNTTVQGDIYFELGNNASQIQLTLSDGVHSLNEVDSVFSSTYSLTQDLINSTLTLSYINSTPWGGLFQDVMYLPSSAMQPDAQTTLQDAFFLGVGKFAHGPDVFYGQYQSVLTISDGTTTAVFDPTPAPEPGTLALSVISGLAGLFIFHRRIWRRAPSTS